MSWSVLNARSRFNAAHVVLSFALLAPLAAQAADACALYRRHAPKDLGLVLDKATSAAAGFCQAWSADRKTTLMLRVMKSGNTAQAVGGVRQGAINAGNGTVADEAGLGGGAWSLRKKRGIEITFAAKGNLVQVVLTRDPASSDADAAKARGFAKAIAGAL
jgi:hypothetical protein